VNLRDRLEAIEADISTLQLDAIVNAANEPLIMGGGVDGAIRRKAGPEMAGDLRRIGRCPTGQAVITPGYRLAAKHVIHTVAPVWSGGGATREQKEALLADCYRNSLALADANEISAIAFPCIGTGIYGWPADRAAQVAIDPVVHHLNHGGTQTRVVLCCFSNADRERYAALIDALPD
jgi:O-acetyl-ADP-ribose deacetylase (regulator of RNase III)